MSTHHRPRRTLPPTIRPITGEPSGATAFAAPTHYDPADPVFVAHEGGKLAVTSTKELRDRRDLSLLYTPGVADVCLAIAADPSLASVYTMRRNTVAVISSTNDGVRNRISRSSPAVMYCRPRKSRKLER